nr:DUF637 domain-containing protein [uncultured Moellerella sp.]
MSNNIPIINIATPNSADISHNKFQNFNVDKQGAVLNNATANINSQLAGQIRVNANLKGKAANLIINEVTGSGRSQLQGKLEVAGKQANVLIANPNGITCNGCSFLNTPAITLTTGKPIMDNKGMLSAIDVKKGSVVIGAQGMNAEAQSFADIISRATELNGQIKAKNLTLMQGTNRVDFQKGTVTPTTGEGVKPTISVDTKALGGMYANQVRLVSTEAGVGVNLSHIQTTQNDLTLTVDGKITTSGNIQAKNNLNVSTKDIQINTNAKLQAGNDITLGTNTLNNQGQIIANNDMRIFSDKLTNIGEKALIKANKDLWIQKNAKGDLSTSIENKSATIKTEQGDLIVRTKKLLNIAESNPIIITRLEATQTQNKDKYLIAFSREKHTISDTISFGRIISSNNIYINANEFINSNAFLKANKDIIITGNNVKILSYQPGNLNLWYQSNPNDKFYSWEPDKVSSSLLTGKNIVFDYNNNIYIGYEIPKTEFPIKKKIKKHNDVNIIESDNILLKSNNMSISGSISVTNDASALAKENVDISYSDLNAGGNVSLISGGDLTLKNSNVNSENVSFITRTGNFDYSSNGITTIDNQSRIILSTLNTRGNITINSGGEININNIVNIKNKETSLLAHGNIILNRIEDIFTKYLLGQHINAFDSKITRLWESSGDISFSSGKSIAVRGITLNSDKSINLNAERDISLAHNPLSDKKDNLFSVGRLPELLTRIYAIENITLNAGRNIEIKSASITANKIATILSGQNIQLTATEFSASPSPTENFIDLRYYPTSITANKELTIAANNAITAQGSYITSLGNIIISSGGDIRLESLRTHFRRQYGKRLDDKYNHLSTRIQSGKSLTILSEGSILFQASKIISKGVMDIAAKGGYLYAQAMEETSYYEDTKKKCNKWTLCITRKTVRTTHSETKNKVTEFTAGGDINLLARDDVTLEATKINTGKNAKITSQTGKINFKAVKNTTFKQVISNSKGFYITQRNKGYTQDQWVLPAVHIGGKLTIDAAKGITADIKNKNNQSLQNALNTLGQTEGTLWLKGLKDRKDVQWNLVKDAYDGWDYKSQSLNPVASALIMISVAAMTSGTATQFAAWAASGSSGTTAAIISGAAYSGMTALSTQTAVALAENQGNLSKTLNTLGKSDTVKSIITQMVISGALNGLDAQMAWTKGNPANAKLPLLSNGDWNKVAQRVAAQSVISSTINTSIQGGSFADNFKNALLSNIGNQVNAEGAKLIGDKGEILGYPGKAISHAALSGLSAEIKQGNTRGAIVGALAAELAAISLGDNTIKADEWQKKSEAQAQFVRAFGGFAGAIFTGNPGGVYSGADAAETTFRYNYLSHYQDKLKNKQLAAETNDFKKALIAVKWLYLDLDQDVAFGAGVISGVPAGLYETIDGLANLASNPKETYTALRAVLMSDDTLGIMTDAVRLSYLSRFNKMESEYQKAGTEGAFKAGVEGGKLIFDIAGTFAGGAGVAKGGVNLVEKVSEKIASKGLIGTTTNGYKVYNGSNTMISKSSLEHPIVQSRINIQIGDSKAGWEHIMKRHFSGKSNASQFTISQSEVKSLLQNPEVAKIPISKTQTSVNKVTGEKEILYQRIIMLDKSIGIDKFSNGSTNTMTILTDKHGNLVTATPGVIN